MESRCSRWHFVPVSPVCVVIGVARHVLAIVFAHLDGLIENLQHVGSQETPLAQKLNARPVTLQEIAMLDNLANLGLGHLHQGIDLVLGSLEVLNAKGICRDDAHARPVADFEDLVIISSHSVK